MAEDQPISFADSLRKARQRLGAELEAQAGRIHRLKLELAELQRQHERTEQEAIRQWGEVARAAELDAAAGRPPVSPDTALENVLSAVRNLMTCTIPTHVLTTLTEESAQLGVRAAIFDVRGKSAWGASAHGFGPALAEDTLRSLIIPLNQDNPFRQVCETAGHVDASTATLERNPNILDRLKPAPDAPVLLLPVRSAGAVTAIYYADPGETSASLPVNALKILVEFAGAQIDRLIALSGGFAPEAAAAAAEPAEELQAEEVPVEAAATEAEEVQPAPSEPSAGETGAEQPVAEVTLVEVHTEVEVVESLPPVPAADAPAEEVAVAPPEPVVSAVENEPSPDAVQPPAVVEEVPTAAEEPIVSAVENEPSPDAVQPPDVEEEVPTAAAEFVVSAAEDAPSPADVQAPAAAILPPPFPADFDVALLSEVEQKVHKDAKRFARLLVSEIELYNKAKVADGRRNQDLYIRLKSDIDRSRQTFDKRFGKLLSREFDYFHVELVKTLAANDPAGLGPEYPWPSA